MQMKLLRISNEDFDIIDQRLIKFSIYSRSVIHKFQESLCFSKEGSIIQYSH
jgi:hypothetical protein